MAEIVLLMIMLPITYFHLELARNTMSGRPAYFMKPFFPSPSESFIGLSLSNKLGFLWVLESTG